MASGTIYGTTSNEYIDSKIEWSSYGNNVDTNTSKVQAKLYYRRNNTGYTTYGSGSFGIKVGESNITVSKSLSISTSWVLAIDSGGVSVTHNSDGTKSITISASGSISGTTLESTKCSATVTLDTIPRASAITSASDISLGSNCNIKWTPASSSFRYKIKFSLGSWSYTTGAIHPNTASAYTYTGYAIPKTVANQMTTSNSGTMTATLYTYSDSSATKQVGSASSKTFKVNLVAATPTLKCAFYPVSLISHPLGEIFIQGLTKLRVDFSKSTGQYGASIVSGYADVEGKSYRAESSTQVTTDCLNTSGSVKVKCTVFDSRGNATTNATATTDAPNSITVYPYSKPKIVKNTGENSIICHRCNAGGDLDSKGTFLRIKATRQYSTVEGRNTSTLKYAIRAVGSSSLYASGTLLDDARETPNVVDTILNVNLLTTTSYTVMLTLEDKMGYSDTFTETIPTDAVAMHLRDGGKGVAFGKYSENDNSFEIADDWDVYGRVYGLGKLKAIPSGADLNNYKDFGVYGIYSNNIANTLKNCPYAVGGRLIVLSATGDGKNSGEYAYILQRYISLDGSQEFYRTVYTGSTADVWIYSAWKSR